MLPSVTEPLAIDQTSQEQGPKGLTFAARSATGTVKLNNDAQTTAGVTVVMNSSGSTGQVDIYANMLNVRFVRETLTTKFHLYSVLDRENRTLCRYVGKIGYLSFTGSK